MIDYWKSAAVELLAQNEQLKAENERLRAELKEVRDKVARLLILRELE